MPPPKHLIIDNGGAVVRSGFSGNSDPDKTRLNAVARGKRDKKIYVADKILPLSEYLLARPLHRGLVVDWETEKVVWASAVFGGKGAKSSERSESLVVTSAAFLPTTIKREMYDVGFRDFQFSDVLVVDSSLCAQFSPGITNQFSNADWSNPCGIIVDCGFSYSTVIPLFNTQPVVGGSVRVPVGGRVLNNLLRERLAYLQLDLDDNPMLVEHIREEVCEVAHQSLGSILAHPRPEHRLSYLLPDSGSHGRVMDSGDELGGSGSSQTITVGADRFAIPEALFSPRTFGIDSIGLAEAVALAISRCEAPIRSALGAKIIVCGGVAKTKGFLTRLSSELEAAIHTPVRLLCESDGKLELSVWRGAAQLRDEDIAFLGGMRREDWLGDRE